LAQALATHGRAGAVLRLTAEERAQETLELDIRVRPDEGTSLKLPPLILSASPDDAAREAMAFLERWGFLGARQLA
jgi:hypothetical protein